jgi:hypothetical protein
MSQIGYQGILPICREIYTKLVLDLGSEVLAANFNKDPSYLSYISLFCHYTSQMIQL